MFLRCDRASSTVLGDTQTEQRSAEEREYLIEEIRSRQEERSEVEFSSFSNLERKALVMLSSPIHPSTVDAVEAEPFLDLLME